MKLKSVPWVRVGAEFAVIFLGITLSLAADDWRQERETRVAEAAALEALHADLIVDSTELASMLRRMDSWNQAAVWTRRRLDSASAEPDSALRRLSNLATFTLYQPNASTYSSLKAGGQLTLVRDPRVRRSVVEYYEVSQPFMLQFADRLTRIHGEYEALVLDHALPVLADSAGSLWPPGPAAFTTSWDAFRRDPRSAPAVASLGMSAGNWAERIRTVLVRNGELRASMGAFTAR